MMINPKLSVHYSFATTMSQLLIDSEPLIFLNEIVIVFSGNSRFGNDFSDPSSLRNFCLLESSHYGAVIECIDLQELSN